MELFQFENEALSPREVVFTVLDIMEKQNQIKFADEDRENIFRLCEKKQDLYVLARDIYSVSSISSVEEGGKLKIKLMLKEFWDKVIEIKKKVT